MFTPAAELRGQSRVYDLLSNSAVEGPDHGQGGGNRDTPAWHGSRGLVDACWLEEQTHLPLRQERLTSSGSPRSNVPNQPYVGAVCLERGGAAALSCRPLATS